MSKTKITKIQARPLWDGEGFPTLEIEVSLRYGALGQATVRRASKPASSFHETEQAIAYTESHILAALKGRNSINQEEIDKILAQLAGDAEHFEYPPLASAVSRAVLNAAANTEKLPLWQYLGIFLGNSPADTMPLPSISVFPESYYHELNLNINGLSMIPIGASHFDEALVWCNKVHHQLMHATAAHTGPLQSDEQAFEELTKAIETSGLQPGHDMGIAFTGPTTRRGADNRYHLNGTANTLTSDELSGRYVDWLAKFPIVSIEDPFAADDREGFTRLTWAVGKSCQIVVSDRVAADTSQLQQSIAGKEANATVLNHFYRQTISDSKTRVSTAKNAHFGASLSLDPIVSDSPSSIHMAVGWGINQIKTAMPTHPGSNRAWNTGLRIAESIAHQSAGALPATGALPPRTVFPWGKLR